MLRHVGQIRRGIEEDAGGDDRVQVVVDVLSAGLSHSMNGSTVTATNRVGQTQIPDSNRVAPSSLGSTPVGQTVVELYSMSPVVASSS